MALVRLYEDLDGCINAPWNATHWKREGDTDQQSYKRAFVTSDYDDWGHRKESDFGMKVKYRLEWNERLIEELNALTLEFVWTSTWRMDCLKFGKRMRLNPQHGLRVLHPLDRVTRFPSIHWKYDAILADQERSPSPFIAVDDEWNDVHPDVWKSLTDMGGLVISPIYNYGLTPTHIEQMKSYIKKHS